jgi:hypothetical protein
MPIDSAPGEVIHRVPKVTSNSKSTVYLFNGSLVQGAAFDQPLPTGTLSQAQPFLFEGFPYDPLQILCARPAALPHW